MSTRSGKLSDDDDDGHNDEEDEELQQEDDEEDEDEEDVDDEQDEDEVNIPSFVSSLLLISSAIAAKSGLCLCNSSSHFLHILGRDLNERFQTCK